MSSDLSGFLSRLQHLLNDQAAEIWSQSLLEECLRFALQELQQVCPYPLQISGMDDASQTTLDQEISLSPLLLLLAQQQALSHRQVQRSESFHPDPMKQIDPLTRGCRRQELKDEVEHVRLYFLQRSPTTPY